MWDSAIGRASLMGKCQTMMASVTQHYQEPMISSRQPAEANFNLEHCD